MARATTVTLLSLERFRAILGLDPLQFNAVQLPGIDYDSQTDVPYFQYPWQASRRLSREEIAGAIAMAERAIANEAGYFPMPAWVQDERREVARPLRPELYRSNALNLRGQSQSIQSRYGYAISGGRRGATVIENGAAITWAALDGLSWAPTGTVASATAVTEPQEVHVFYPGHAGDPAWEIRPIEVSIAAGTATITIRRELCVLEELIERLNLRFPTSDDIHAGVDGTDDLNFLEEVDVYRIYNDPSIQVRLEWEPDPGLCGCGAIDCVVCGIGYQMGCLTPRNSEQGILAFRPATWDPVEASFTAAALAVGRAPDWVRYWYRSGWRWDEPHATNVYVNMDPFWERVVSYLAIAFLPRGVHTTQNVEALVNYWREDLALTNPSSSHQVGPRVIESPWGTTRAAIWAYEQIRQRKVAIGTAVLL